MAENITNLASYDPFADTGSTNQLSVEGYIHIRIQQRNGRKSITTIQGLPKEIDQKRLLKAFKKEFACNGNLVEDEEMGEVIQMSGDQREKVQNFLTSEGIATKNSIKVPSALTLRYTDSNKNIACKEGCIPTDIDTVSCI